MQEVTDLFFVTRWNSVISASLYTFIVFINDALKFQPAKIISRKLYFWFSAEREKHI